jgi:hypothetical protein
MRRKRIKPQVKTNRSSVGPTPQNCPSWSQKGTRTRRRSDSRTSSVTCGNSPGSNSRSTWFARTRRMTITSWSKSWARVLCGRRPFQSGDVAHHARDGAGCRELSDQRNLREEDFDEVVLEYRRELVSQRRRRHPQPVHLLCRYREYVGRQSTATLRDQLRHQLYRPPGSRARPPKKTAGSPVPVPGGITPSASMRPRRSTATSG